MVGRARQVSQLFEALEGHFGQLGWWPARDQLEICTGAILTQNTAWRNVERALMNLREAGVITAGRFLAIDTPQLAELIRPAGYYNQKAKKLKLFMRWLHESYNNDLLAVASQPLPELRRQLLSLWGVGEETADAMLCYAFGKPVFVVDAYLKRILVRHGLAAPDDSYADLQQLVHSAISGSADHYNDAHAWIVETGKRWCGRRKARCEECPLEKLLR